MFDVRASLHPLRFGVRCSMFPLLLPLHSPAYPQELAASAIVTEPPNAVAFEFHDADRSVVRCPLSVVRCPLSVGRCPLSVVRCPLSVVRCPLKRCPKGPTPDSRLPTPDISAFPPSQSCSIFLEQVAQPTNRLAVHPSSRMLRPPEFVFIVAGFLLPGESTKGGSVFSGHGA